MKKYQTRIAIALGLMMMNVAPAMANDITLGDGQSIRINNTVVTCSAGYNPTPPTNPNNLAAMCTRLQSMSERDAFEIGLTQGVGRCYIINNSGYFGVMNSGQQISPTYTCGSGSSSSYNSQSYCASTGLVQLVCSGRCL